MYKDKQIRTQVIKAWSDSVANDASYRMDDLAELIAQRRPSNASPMGYAGQSIAKVLVLHCGWSRFGRILIKRRAAVQPLDPVAGAISWSRAAPDRASASAMADHFNQWSDGKYRTVTARGMVTILRAAGYKVISRPHNVAVYGRDVIRL